MGYASIALAFLNFAGALFSFLQRRQLISEGQAIAFAKSAAEVLRKSGYAKQALEEASSMSDDELDQRLRDFEPREPDSK